MIELGKTVMLTSSEDMKTITLPLEKYFNITIFAYVKSYADGTHITLGNCTSWLHCFYTYFHQYGVCHKIMESYNSGYYLWSQAVDQTTVNIQYTDFNIANGINVIKKHENYCEFFCFGTTRENSNIVNWYLNNMDVLEGFCLYFKAKAKHLIKKAEVDRLILPRNLAAKSYEILPDVSSIEARESFLKDIVLDRNCLINNSYNSFEFETLQKLNSYSKRESECIYHLIRGKTAKLIAKELNISPRTVEHHIENIKIKLGVSSRAALIERVIDEGLIT